MLLAVVSLLSNDPSVGLVQLRQCMHKRTRFGNIHKLDTDLRILLKIGKTRTRQTLKGWGIYNRTGLNMLPEPCAQTRRLVCIA